MTHKRFTKAALAFSLALFAVWLMLGTASTLTWFNDSDQLVNLLYFGNLDVEVYYKTPGGYDSIDNSTSVFDSDALYEPGYTQVVYFKVCNEGTVDFTYNLSVIPSDWVYGVNAENKTICLSDYLKFGVVYGDTEQEVASKLGERSAAAGVATTKLSDYSKDCGTLAVGKTEYFALVVYMPQEISNEANYRGDKAPSVNLGICVKANQIK